MCSLFIDNHGGMLLLIKKNRSHHVNGSHMCKWINMICYQINLKIMRFFFKVRPLFLHISKCRTICRNSNNIILNSIPCMVIHKLRSAIAPEQSLQTWNDENIAKNLVRHLFCYLIWLIYTYMSVCTFCCKFILIVIYNMVIEPCMNCFIMHSNLYYDGR